MSVSLQKSEQVKYQTILMSLLEEGEQNEYQLAESTRLNRTTIMRIMNKISGSTLQFFTTKPGPRKAKIHAITVRGILHLYREGSIGIDTLKTHYDHFLKFNPLHPIEKEVTYKAIELIANRLISDIPSLEYVSDDYVRTRVSEMAKECYSEAFLQVLDLSQYIDSLDDIAKLEFRVETVRDETERSKLADILDFIGEIIANDELYENIRSMLIESRELFQQEIKKLQVKCSETQASLEFLNLLKNVQLES
jgi:uncharacterized protein (UPF0147 family)